MRRELTADAGTALLKGATSASIAALLALVCAQALLRTRVVPVSFAWADEIIELLFAWMVFLGTAIAWGSREHIVIDLIPQLVAGTRAACGFEIVAAALSLVFLAIFTWRGALFTIQARRNTSPMLTLPRPLWYAPIAGVMMIWHTLRHSATARVTHGLRAPCSSTAATAVKTQGGSAHSDPPSFVPGVTATP